MVLGRCRGIQVLQDELQQGGCAGGKALKGHPPAMTLCEQLSPPWLSQALAALLAPRARVGVSAQGSVQG